MQVSIIVPTFNRRDVVLRAVSTLLQQDFPVSEYEIVVVVDGSTDGTAGALRSLSSACRFRVIEQENRGPSGARNAGYETAEAELLLFLDDDMLCDQGLVAAHVAAHAEHDRIIAFGALFLSDDSVHSLATECFNREIGALHLDIKSGYAVPWQEADCVFSNTSVSRSLLQELGGFDETFRKREDLELGIRLFGAGVLPRYVKNAIAYQHYGKTSGDLIREAEGFAEADVMFASKHPEASTKGQLRWFASMPRWKTNLLKIAVYWQAVADFCLAPICDLGEVFFRVPIFRNMGVKALQIRRRIHWLHKVLQLDRRALEIGSRKIK